MLLLLLRLIRTLMVLLKILMTLMVLLIVLILLMLRTLLIVLLPRKLLLILLTNKPDVDFVFGRKRKKNIVRSIAPLPIRLEHNSKYMYKKYVLVEKPTRDNLW